MILLLAAFLGGFLTILSPCILPVLPFVFSRAGQPFVKNGLPLLLGMAVTFAAVATLAAVGGNWAVQLNQYGRLLALVLLIVLALTLLSDRVATVLTRPFVALGNRLLPADSNTTVLSSLLVGVATGFLWAPCAGPILGLILTSAVISGPAANTTTLLLAYAAGAALSLGLATLAGSRVLSAMKKSLGAGEWLRRGLGALVLLAVVAIGAGWDTGVLTQLSLSSTNRLEQSLINVLGVQTKPDNGAAMTGNSNAMMSNNATMTGNNAMMAGNNAMTGGPRQQSLPIEGTFPSLDGAALWLNSEPLTVDSLRGKVVLIDFWTYSCINCLRALPYVKAWEAKYRDAGLVVIGVHSPEFAFEKSAANVRRAVEDLELPYPVALDNDYTIWRAFNNMYWPAHYFIDATGNVRAHHFGEGSYEESEQIIRRLLTENGATLPQHGETTMVAEGVQAAADQANVQSPETYLGYERAEAFVSPGGFSNDQAHAYTAPASLGLNQWALDGTWTVDGEKAVLDAAPGKVSFRFLARDLHLVLGPAADGTPVRFRVLLDGAPPGANHGIDINENGEGVVEEDRLYQLIRQQGTVGEHTFTIEFLDGGVQAYSFTFG